MEIIQGGDMPPWIKMSSGNRARNAILPDEVWIYIMYCHYCLFNYPTYIKIFSSVSPAFPEPKKRLATK